MWWVEPRIVSAPHSVFTPGFIHLYRTPSTMNSTYQDGASSSNPYKDPTPLPDNIPKVQEIGTTSGPLKSAAFFIGAYCKDYNGLYWIFEYMAFGANGRITRRTGWIEDFMLCKQENRDPAHCLKEGRRVTRCATDLFVDPNSLKHSWLIKILHLRITKMRENCLQQFDAHWKCLEYNNQVGCLIDFGILSSLFSIRNTSCVANPNEH